MLFIIVAAFLICSIPRFSLNVVELVSVLPWYYAKYFDPDPMGEKSPCFQMPAWTHVLAHISSFLMTLNASLGFLIYCVACKTFRDELMKLLKRALAFRREQHL